MGVEAGECRDANGCFCPSCKPGFQGMEKIRETGNMSALLAK